MMNEAEMQRILRDAQAVRQEGASRAPATRVRRDALFRELHILAEAQYPPAIAFFESCLTDLDPEWRLESLRNVGFHYRLPAGNGVINRIRLSLTNDPDPHVRMAAAGALASQRDQAMDWPDWALEGALRADPVKEVRSAAFDALLSLSGVPPLVAHRVRIAKLQGDEIPATWEELVRIIAASRASPAPA